MGDPRFRDLFSSAAPAYAAFRPAYADDLLDFAAALAPARRCAWDCGTGSGQAALGLAGRFETVVATDASGAQLGAARRHPRVLYVQAAAEACPLVSRSVDLVVAAQALHWFDRSAFFAEVRRVLAERGAIAVWTYELVEIAPEIDGVLRQFYAETLGPFWPPERRLVEAGYSGIEFPFHEIEVPRLVIAHDWTLAALAGYIGTWSAVQRFRGATGADPIPHLVRDLAPLWGDPFTLRRVRWPIAARAGHV